MQRQRVNKLDCVVPCLDEEADMLEWAGISFGQDFTYKLSKSLKVSSPLLLNRRFAETGCHEWCKLPQILW